MNDTLVSPFIRSVRSKIEPVILPPAPVGTATQNMLSDQALNVALPGSALDLEGFVGAVAAASDSTRAAVIEGKL
ncbi:hypothetical protein [Paraburkholderia ferrariae]|uniref:hypothetical protein n=1 Tax=Paraburkholderia ferrariae TaxID=386056 RepID=UPI0012EB627C|nr:hypothetical protein [Paraburkholderia ferrariae]